MNVAILIPTLGIGGAERAALYVADRLRRRGDNPIFFLYEKAPFRTYHNEESAVYIPYRGGKSRLETVQRLFTAARMTRRAKREYQIDTAVSFLEKCNYINLLSKGREHTVISTRTTLSRHPDFQGMIFNNRFLIRRLYPRAERIVCVSGNTGLDLAEHYGVPEKKMVVIPNAAARHDSPDRAPWPYGDNAVIHVGRLTPVKQQDRMIRAFSVVLREKPDAKLILIGDGELRNYLKMTAKRCGAENAVVFTGYSEDVGYYLRHGKVFVMASQVEGFPNAMVEAMAWGLPVITTDSPGGCPEIVGKEQSENAVQHCAYGVLTPYFSGKAGRNPELEPGEQLLGEAMLEMLTNDALCAEYSRRSLARAEDYSDEKIWKLWETVLQP